MYCICCKKNNIIPMSPHKDWNGTPTIFTKREKTIKEEDILWSDKKGIDSECLNDGVAGIIDAGYGSTHDGDQFIIAICDDCIKENKESGVLLYYSNYMYGDMRYIKDEIDKSKQIYRRRKNLDDLNIS